MSHSARKPRHTLDPLDRVGWLSGEPREFRDWVAEHGRWHRYAPGNVIYLAGDEPDGLYGLGNGTIEVAFPLEGAEAVSFHRAEPGFWIGESAYLAGEVRSVSLTAVSEALVFHIPAEAIERRLAGHPETWRSLYRQSHINATMAVRMLAEAIALSPQARFCRLLIRQSATSSEVVGTQESLGALVGLRFTTAKRVVQALVAAGAIRSGYGKIAILDRGMLERMANDDWDFDELAVQLRRENSGIPSTAGRVGGLG